MLCLGPFGQSEELWGRQDGGVCCKGNPGTRRAPETIAKRVQDLPSHPARGLTEQGTGPSWPRRAAHPLLSFEGVFCVCITTFEGFPRGLVVPGVCFLSVPAATRPGQVQEHLHEGLLLARRLSLSHPGTRPGTVLFPCPGRGWAGMVPQGHQEWVLCALCVPTHPNAPGCCPHPSCGESPSHPPVKCGGERC